MNKFPGGHRGRVPPVPIPNTEVKPATADGTACAGVWESRSLPGLFFRMPFTAFVTRPPRIEAAFFLYPRSSDRVIGLTRLHGSQTGKSSNFVCSCVLPTTFPRHTL